MNGEIRVVGDVPAAYSDLLADTVRGHGTGPFVLGCSGGASGAAVLRAAVSGGRIDWSRVIVVFADERCVAPDSPDSNERTVRDALGANVFRLAGFYPMRCAEGADAYATVLSGLGRIDLLQLGLGPDGHTASLFPSSPGLSSPPGRLVTENVDPSGKNPYERLSLTFEGIARSHLVVVTVVGAEKATAYQAIRTGARDLPAARLSAERVVWLVDEAAAERADE